LPDVAPVVHTQVWDLPVRLIHVTDYQQHTVACPCCDTIQQAAAPTGLPPGVFGAGVVALTGMLRRYRLSDREIVDFWQTVVGMPISLGSVVRLCQRMSVALEPLDAAIRTCVQHAPAVHMDETRWREANQSAWLWTAVTAQAISFRIDRARSRTIFAQVLPHADQQIITSDRYGVYHHLANQRRQLCWAHLIRDLRACLERTPAAQQWAQAILTQVQVAFAYWRWYQVELIDRIQLQVLLAPIRATIGDHVRLATVDDPQANTLRADLLQHWDSLWTFSRVEGVEPTNNVAERAIRPAVMWRKICFGTQSAVGSRFVERMLSVVATCRQQGRSVFAILRSTICAFWRKQDFPDLFATP
jgi:transposase